MEHQAGSKSFLAEFPFSYMITISAGAFRGIHPRDDTGFKHATEKYIYRLSKKVYGKNNPDLFLKSYTAFEKMTKAWNNCNIHAHILVVVEKDFKARFEAKVFSEWCAFQKKQNKYIIRKPHEFDDLKSIDFDVVVIDDVSRTVEYVLKQYMHDSFDDADSLKRAIPPRL